jgi:hypothetical protein
MRSRLINIACLLTFLALYHYLGQRFGIECKILMAGAIVILWGAMNIILRKVDKNNKALVASLTNDELSEMALIQTDGHVKKLIEEEMARRSQ